MSTGNTNVQSIVWHKASASIFASTRSDHKVTYDKYGGKYMYDQQVPFDFDSMIERDGGVWPQRSNHEPSKLVRIQHSLAPKQRRRGSFAPVLIRNKELKTILLHT
jgi:hypothetical protein